MNVATVRRTMIVTVLLGGTLLVLAAIAFACVPQQGGIQVENVNAQDPDNQGTKTVTPGTTDGFIVGDGDNNTNHHSSWCGAEGGHPTEAVYAEDEAELEVTIREAQADEVDTGCPTTKNKLPHADRPPSQNDADIWLENGQDLTDGEDVYEWDEPAGGYEGEDGFWNFVQGPGVGCYHPDGDPTHQGTVEIASDGSGNTTFDLNAPPPANSWDPQGDQSEQDPHPGDGAALLCVGDDLEEEDPKAIFAPIVITSV